MRAHDRPCERLPAQRKRYMVAVRQRGTAGKAPAVSPSLLRYRSFAPASIPDVSRYGKNFFADGPCRRTAFPDICSESRPAFAQNARQGPCLRRHKIVMIALEKHGPRLLFPRTQRGDLLRKRIARFFYEFKKTILFPIYYYSGIFSRLASEGIYRSKRGPIPSYRTDLTASDIEERLELDVVQKQLALIKARNTYWSSRR